MDLIGFLGGFPENIFGMASTWHQLAEQQFTNKNQLKMQVQQARISKIIPPPLYGSMPMYQLSFFTKTTATRCQNTWRNPAFL